jgi:hypothetical protein
MPSILMRRYGITWEFNLDESMLIGCHEPQVRHGRLGAAQNAA